ncbi:MAG: 2OG-Fe(II) oxygenase family protein [Gammaproteobacteria bacterium]|nr:2OG-Fe(II) oxygenase family protein [Gammaproteobacteria bacterium]
MNPEQLLKKWQEASVEIDGEAVPVWPADQELFALSDRPRMLETHFTDFALYHDALAARAFELEKDPEYTHQMIIGGSKIKDIDRWNIPEATLVCERVRALFSMLTGKPEPVMDLCWANISRYGDYLTPHSHTYSIGSSVYFLSLGDPDPDRPLSGRLAFADPRIAACCPGQDDCMTKEINPDARPGTTVMFPSQMVHFVHPYTGKTPRITLAFNLS